MQKTRLLGPFDGVPGRFLLQSAEVLDFALQDRAIECGACVADCHRMPVRVCG